MTVTKTQSFLQRKKTEAQNLKGLRRGFAMTEIILVMILIGIAIAAAYYLYGINKVNEEAKKLDMKLTQAVKVIQAVKSDDSDVLPAKDSNTKIKDIPEFLDRLGGLNVAGDVGEWYYSCPAGDSSKVTITTTPQQDQKVIDNVAQKVKKYDKTGWKISKDGNQIILEADNNTCR